MADLRKEVETSITSWLGVLGYDRTVRWAGVPVYQNFVNLGSQLPLMSHISSSPLASLGSLVPVQIAQQLLLAAVLIGAAWAVASSPALQTLSLRQCLPLSTIFLVPTSHYFLANDWSELAIATVGATPLFMLLVELNLGFKRTAKQTGLLLWLAFSCLSIDHFGHIGALSYPLLVLILTSIQHDDFRRIISGRVLISTAVLSLLVVAYWFHDVKFLSQNGVTANPRSESLGSQVAGFLSAGFGSSVESIMLGQLKESVIFLASTRTLFLIWPIFVVLAALRFSHNGSRKLCPLQKSWLIRVAGTVLAISSLALFAGRHAYPFRPSADYQFRDALLPLLMLTYFSVLPASGNNSLSTDPNLNSSKNRRNERATQQHPLGLAMFTVIATCFLIIAAPYRKGAATETAPNCGSLGKGATIFAADSSWRGQQPDDPNLPAQCSLFQVIRDDQFSINGWLKMRQTPSDGQAKFELENKVADVAPALLELMPIDAIVQNGTLALANRPDGVRIDSSDSVRQYQRCQTGQCVMKIEPSEGVLIWNFDPNLRIDSEDSLNFGRTSVWPTLNTEGPVLLAYQVPLTQKIAISAGWSLHVGIPLWMLIMSALSNLRRPRISAR
jgi:hypothetical protein